MDARGVTLRNVFLGAGLLLCILYGLLTVHHSQSLRAGETAWWNEFMALTVSEEYATGPRSFHILQEGEGKPYRIALAQMSWHMAVGGIGLTFGVFQFIPALRRKVVLSDGERLP